MKKLTTLLFALFFTAGVAFAQNNTATTNQNGVNNTVNIDQTDVGPDANDNVSTVNQTGDNHMAIIDQSGDDRNNATINQTNNTGEMGNMATIIQTGDDDLDATITQNGEGNEAFIYQLNSSINDDDNNATVTQTGDGSYAEVTQENGAGNNATVSQSSGFGTGHSAIVTQMFGDNNFADILQDQANAEATVTQEGSSNETRLKQSGFNTANITLEGTGNKVGAYSDIDGGRAFQKNGTGLFASGFNMLSIDVFGEGNRVGIEQEANTDVDIDITDNGVASLDNEVRVRTKGENGGTLSTVVVDLSDVISNDVDIFQGATGPGTGGNSASVTIERSDDNMIDIDQLAAGNSATVTIGDLNTSNVGFSNAVTIMQNSIGNTATVDIVGASSNNKVVINQ